jgi:uncharacterized protein YwgA
MQTQRLRALAGLIALVGASGEKLQSRIRIQKEAFLLALKGSNSFDPDDFFFHHHGPYSRALSDILHESVMTGFIQETRDDFRDETTRYSYQLTEVGKELLAEGVVADKTIAALTPKLDQCHWRALELAATVAFLQRKGQASNRDGAFEEALKLKPACVGYAAEAKKVFETIGL